VVNPSSNSVCLACGITLLVEQQLPLASPIDTKQSKAKRSQTPPWLSAVLIAFGIYALVVIVYEIQQLPSGSVQKNQQQEAHNHTDPAAIETIAQLEKQVTANPASADLSLQLANALHDAKFYPRAIETYKSYLKLDPDNFDARVDLGICYFEMGNFEQAVKEIESVITKQPKHQMAMFNMGIFQLSNQNIAEAKKWLKRCVDLDPQSTAGLRAQQILQQH